MKHFKLTSRTLLGLTLMGALAAAPLMTPVAQADPVHSVRYNDDNDNRYNDNHDNDRRDDRRDDRHDNRRDRDDHRNTAGRRDNRDQNGQSFVGVVTKVKSDREFDMRINDQTYNVYLNSAAGRVRRGETVRVSGERIGNNDIRSARLNDSRNR